MPRVRPRVVSVIVLAVLAGAPVGGAVCAALCASRGHAGSAAGHDHHTSSAPCHEPLGDLPGMIGGTPGHDCSWHEGDPGESPVVLSARADAGLTSISGHLAAAIPGLIELASLRVGSDSSPPPIRSAATRAPLVLRI